MDIKNIFHFLGFEPIYFGDSSMNDPINKINTI